MDFLTSKIASLIREAIAYFRASCFSSIDLPRASLAAIILLQTALGIMFPSIHLDTHLGIDLPGHQPVQIASSSHGGFAATAAGREQERKEDHEEMEHIEPAEQEMPQAPAALNSHGTVEMVGKALCDVVDCKLDPDVPDLA